MERKINNIAFGPEQADAVKDLLDYLLDYNSKQEYDDYYEIHITTDSYCTIVEFEKVPYSGEWGGKFQYVEDDELVMKEYSFPDDHYEYFTSKEEYKEALDEWLKENPGWERGEFGRWYKKIEEKLEEIIMNNKELPKKIRGNSNE